MRYWKRVLRKLPGGDAYSLAAVALIGLATVLRLALITQGWPPLDSDEGIMGLMGMHIAFRGEFPIFFYGQGYMGTLEAYLAAFFFRLFGTSTFTLLLGLVILYALFLSVMYRLTSLLYSKGLALVTLGLLCFGSNPMLTRELVAIGGYPETLLFGALLLLLASWLALTSSRELDAFTLSERRKRLAAYGLWGFVAGLGLWTHMLVLPFVLLGGLLILFFCRNEWRSPAPFFLLIFLIIGMLPMIIYNVMASPGQDTLSYLLRVHSASGIPGVSARPPFWEQLRGALLISMPTATGATPLCAPSQVDFTRLSDAATMRCTLWHAGWTLGVMALWLLAVVLALRPLRHAWQHRPWSSEERREVISHTARLALLATAALTLLLYVISPDAALFPVATSRYLIGLLVSLPAVLWPLWHSSGAAHQSEHTGSIKVRNVIRYSILLFTASIFLLGTFSIFTGFPPPPPLEQRWGRFATQVNDQHLSLAAAQALNRRQHALIINLQRAGIYHIYSDYWTCNRLIFQSRERIICGVVIVGYDRVKQGQNRYAAYYQTVRADPRSAYVFESGSPEAKNIAHLLARQRQRYRHLTFDGYVVYQPLLGES